MTRFVSILLAILKVFTVTCVGFICVYVAYSLIFWLSPTPVRFYLSRLPGRFTGMPYFSSSRETFGDPAFLLSVDADHQSVFEWVAKCAGRPSVEQLPEPIREEYELPFGETSFSVGPVSEDQQVDVTDTERALLQLSRNIGFERVLLRKKISDSYFFLQIAILLTIGIGMITTILVSLSSTEFGRGDGTVQRVVRVLAIVFPALGTATAAVIAFYSPQSTLSQSSRTLASLTQIQQQMAIEVWNLKGCNPKNPTDADNALQKPLKDWESRYEDVETVAQASAFADVGGNSGGGAGPGNSGSQKEKPGGAQATGEPKVNP
jgi:hypothetical protein